MKLVLFLVGLAILVPPQLFGAEQVLLIYNQGNTLFTAGSGKTISSTTSCADPDVAHVLGKYGMTKGYRIGSDATNFLDGYYKFVVSSVTAKECVDSLSALSTIQSAVINGTIEPMYGSTREPIDYWYNHTFRWEYGHHHEACDDDSFMVVPHYRQWYLPRGKYDRAWTVTTGDSTNVIAIIDSSFEIGHPDLIDLWAWNQAELGAASQDSVDNDGNGYVDDVLGWDFGSFAENDSLWPMNPGDADIGHDQRWWQLVGCNQPWECCCDSTGLDYDENFYNRKRQPWGSNRHGTNMSSIIAARTSDDTTLINPGDPEYLNSGVAGINWKTKLLPIKIGSPAEFIADVPPPQWDAMLKALEYVVIRKNQGLNIIAVNMSLSFDQQGDLTLPVPDVFAQKFWDLRYLHGILPIGGAGNARIIRENGVPTGDERRYPVYPCRDPSVFCASCVGYHHQIVSYAQFGDEVDGDYDYENVDLCAFGADNGSCGVNNDPYGGGTCSDTPFGDMRFPGMMVASSETAHRPGWSVCGTVDSECSPGSFCDQGVYGVAPGDTTTLGDLKHVWGTSAFMTSGTTAQLSGLAGLVAAAFPDFGPDEIEAKIIAAADNIDAANPGITPGDLGAGVTNAWKAVTR